MSTDYIPTVLDQVGRVRVGPAGIALFECLLTVVVVAPRPADEVVHLLQVAF